MADLRRPPARPARRPDPPRCCSRVCWSAGGATAGLRLRVQAYMALLTTDRYPPFRLLS